MSISIRHWGLMAALATLAVAGPGCQTPFNTRMPRPSQPPGPVINFMRSTPTTISAKDGAITFTVSATDRDKKALKYAWSTGIGTLSATTGTTVTWKPVSADGTPLDVGMNSVTVVVSNGVDTATGRTHLRINGPNQVEVITPDRIVEKPKSPSPSPTPSGGAIGTPITLPSSATGSPAALRVGAVSPSLAAPDTVFTISGAGFPADAAVRVGNSAAEVLEVKPDRITAKVPATLPINEQPLQVQVIAGGQTLDAEGTLAVADTSDFGGGVKLAGRGLMTTVYALDAGTDQLPGDLDRRTPAASFLASLLDVPAGQFSVGFPTTAGPLVDHFALRFAGQINVAQAGQTRFTLLSDDGARLYIDDQLVVDNDGLHGPTEIDGAVTLTAGKHRFRLDYFQGPRFQVALQLHWTPAGATQEALVPADAFSP